MAVLEIGVEVLHTRPGGFSYGALIRGAAGTPVPVNLVPKASTSTWIACSLRSSCQGYPPGTRSWPKAGRAPRPHWLVDAQSAHTAL
jgi:hypothetical protein